MDDSRGSNVVQFPLRFVCQAIHTRTLLEFEYEGLPRVVAPYRHGVTSRGLEMLQAVQLRGESASGHMGVMKLWHMSKIVSAHVTSERFVADEALQAEEDGAIVRVHCRL